MAALNHLSCIPLAGDGKKANQGNAARSGRPARCSTDGRKSQLDDDVQPRRKRTGMTKAGSGAPVRRVGETGRVVPRSCAHATCARRSRSDSGSAGRQGRVSPDLHLATAVVAPRQRPMALAGGAHYPDLPYPGLRGRAAASLRCLQPRTAGCGARQAALRDIGDSHLRVWK